MCADVRPKTLLVRVPSNGTPVPLLYQRSRNPFIIRTSSPVRIGSQDSLNADSGLYLEAGAVFGMGAADFDSGSVPLGQLYAVTASTGLPAVIEDVAVG